jgi:hypothetical protein
MENSMCFYSTNQPEEALRANLYQHRATAFTLIIGSINRYRPHGRGSGAAKNFWGSLPEETSEKR